MRTGTNVRNHRIRPTFFMFHYRFLGSIKTRFACWRAANRRESPHFSAKCRAAFEVPRSAANCRDLSLDTSLKFFFADLSPKASATSFKVKGQWRSIAAWTTMTLVFASRQLLCEAQKG